MAPTIAATRGAISRAIAPRGVGRCLQPEHTSLSYRRALHGRTCHGHASCNHRRKPNGSVPMLIRIGYDIELAVATPMALIYLLRVHPSRRDDLVAPESVRVSGGLVPEEYIDSFGNHCGRVNVPVGMSTVR